MKVLIMSVGTRGDCEPFLALANLLRDKGDEVICALPEEYKNLADEENFEFFSMGNGFLHLMNSKYGREVMGSKSSGRKLISATRLYKKSKAIQKHVINVQRKIVEDVNPDCIIFHPLVMYPIPWHIETGKKAVLLCPVPCIIHPVENFASLGFNRNLGKIGNRLSYSITNTAIGALLKTTVNDYLGAQYSARELTQDLKEVKTIYPISKAIFKYQKNWPDTINISGFLERDKVHAWTPPAGFENFLNFHEKIMLITFGSMINSDPEKTTSIVLNALTSCNIPAIINISGGGLVEPKRYDKHNFFFTQSIPYDYILPKVYATVHHGGAGTTHSSLKAGCATMAIPHTADQPLWNQWIYNLGVGPKGIQVGKLTSSELSKKLMDLYTNPMYKSNAQSLQQEMLLDNDFEDLYHFISQ